MPNKGDETIELYLAGGSDPIECNLTAVEAETLRDQLHHLEPGAACIEVEIDGRKAIVRLDRIAAVVFGEKERGTMYSC